MSEEEWTSVLDALPISGYKDPLFKAPFHDEPVKAKTLSGKIIDCNFWCCWDEGDDDNFIREFDCEETVTHWRRT